ncbi:MAG: sigma-54-dependent Fis family transcriptional regulator [Pirellulaceae bacterium]|nr:MAG: sigma-54-dependent Fis family transcriptional regulator [Pirellulaceae bacterium]
MPFTTRGRRGWLLGSDTVGPPVELEAMKGTSGMSRPVNVPVVLLVEDDAQFRKLAVQGLLAVSKQGYEVLEAGTPGEAWDLLQRREVDVVILDMVLPGCEGLEVLARVRQEHPDCQVVLLTGQGTIEAAVQAMKLGAYDFLTKPVPMRELEAVVAKACERRQLEKENQQLRSLLRSRQPNRQIIGKSPAMQEVFRLIERAGPSDMAILIQGESGTGKELVAHALHRASRRADKPMVVINCAALPEALLESELFGHERGAFTGAVSAKPGLFEVADGGTLFIDEIGELPGPLQAKLLRVLEDGSLRRVGSVKERRVDVRLLAATNRRLAEEVKAGRFREDLYYRINVMSLELPPLRERREDIPLLVEHFLGAEWQIEPQALQYLVAYEWPGNVRQLSNALERAKILADDRLIRVRDLPRDVVASGDSGTPTAAVAGDNLAALERAKIVEVLHRERGNKSRAARALGIDRRKLYRLVEKYGIR